jgi:hypothetical protein
MKMLTLELKNKIDNLILENSALKIELSNLLFENKELHAEIQTLKSPIYLSYLCDVLLQEYSMVLNPAPIEFEHGLLKYQININDLICIESDGKLKKLHFRKDQTSLTNLHQSTDCIKIFIKYDDLIEKLDPSHSILCLVSRKYCVNSRLYFNTHRKIHCQIELKVIWKDKLNEISIEEKYFEEFIKLKCIHEQIKSWSSKLGR